MQTRDHHQVSSVLILYLIFGVRISCQVYQSSLQLDWPASEPQGSCPSAEWITLCLITFSFKWVWDQILVLMLGCFANRAIFSILENFFCENSIAILMMLLILGLISPIPQHPSDYEEVSHYGFDWHVTNTVLSIFTHTIDHLHNLFFINVPNLCFFQILSCLFIPEFL